MKLATFNEGRVGRIDDDTMIELDCDSTVEWFERDGKVPETGTRIPMRDVTLRAPIKPRKFFHTAGNFLDHHE